MKRRTLIGYIRVSTKRQGESGLGLEAQLQALQAYAQQVGATILRVYKEVESGRRSDRPELRKAIAHARRSGALLVVAKLDRLARNVAFTSALMESRVDFLCCDNPHATPLTIHILAAVAEYEAMQISQRTKAALAAYKARGGKLGGSLPQCRNLTNDARWRGTMKARQVVRQLAIDAYADLAPLVTEWRQSGMTLQQIADALNDEGHTTRRGASWNHVHVHRLMKRIL